MVPSKPGTSRNLGLSCVTSSKSKGKRLASGTQQREIQPGLLPETKGLFSRAEVDMGTDALFEEALKPPFSKHVFCPSS
jgi:16S rRNA G1207 methylase RsmC